jgi:hypothetical protein
MRKPSQIFFDIQANIASARAHLLDMRRLLAGWNEFNEAAETRLTSAARLAPQDPPVLTERRLPEDQALA